MSALARDPKIGFGRFKVYPRADGRFIVYDPTRPLGARTVGDFATIREATDECRLVSDRASAAGEPNEVERYGLKLDWGDPKTWEATANVPPRPLFPSLHAKDEDDGQEEERSRSARPGPRRSAGAGLGPAPAAAAASGRRP